MKSPRVWVVKVVAVFLLEKLQKANGIIVVKYIVKYKGFLGGVPINTETAAVNLRAGTLWGAR